MVREAATEVRAFLGELGIAAFPKTTGNRGLHLYVRVEPGWDSFGVRQAAVSVAREMERRRPDLVTGAWWKEERGGRVFIDFNQNAPHKTVFGAWCVRARAGAQVSTPFAWDELAAIEPDELSIRTVPGARRAPRRPVGGDGRRAAVDRAAARSSATGPRSPPACPTHPWPPVYPKMPDEAPRVAPSRARKPSGAEG